MARARFQPQPVESNPEDLAADAARRLWRRLDARGIGARLAALADELPPSGLDVAALDLDAAAAGQAARRGRRER